MSGLMRWLRSMGAPAVAALLVFTMMTGCAGKQSADKGAKDAAAENGQAPAAGESEAGPPKAAGGASRNPPSGTEVRDGVYDYYYKSGMKKHQVFYKKGLKDGREMRWRENGKEQEQREYKDNMRHGFWVRWNENGVKVSEREYREDKAHGHWSEWDDAGRLTEERDYDNGRLVSMKKHGPAGQ